MVGGRLTRLHLWLGELLGVTRYDNCWNCRHADVLAAHSDGTPVMGVVWCKAQEDEDEDGAICDPCEAVWCDMFEDKED